MRDIRAIDVNPGDVLDVMVAKFTVKAVSIDQFTNGRSLVVLTGEWGKYAIPRSLAFGGDDLVRTCGTA